LLKRYLRGDPLSGPVDYTLEWRCPHCRSRRVGGVRKLGSPIIMDGGPQAYDEQKVWLCYTCFSLTDGSEMLVSETDRVGEVDKERELLPAGPSGLNASYLPHWYDDAVRIAKPLRAQTRRSPRAKHNVYIALLNDPEHEHWGLYVGMTGLEPEARFIKHKLDVQAGKGWVRDYGVTLLPALYAHLNPCEYEEADQLEKFLIEALSLAVPWVQGA